MSLSEFARIVAGASGRGLLVEDQLPDVTIPVGPRLDLADAINLLYATLARSGFELILSKSSLEVRKNAAVQSVKANRSVVQAIRLNFIDAASFLNLAATLMPRDRFVTVGNDAGLLVYIGPESGAGTLKDIRSLLDVYELGNTVATIIPIRASAPGELADSVIEAAGLSRTSYPRLLPLPRNHALLLIAPSSFDTTELRRMIDALDHATLDDTNPVRSITPRNRTAEDLIATLHQLVDSGSAAAGVPLPKADANPSLAAMDTMLTEKLAGDADTGLRGAISPAGDQPRPTEGRSNRPAATGSDDSLAGLRSIVSRAAADKSTNRILFTGTPAEFTILKRAIAALDENGGQILIEAVVLQVALTDQLQFGVQYALKNAKIFGTPVSGGLNTAANETDGLILTLGPSGFQTVIHALDQLTNVNVISSPKLLVASGDKGQFHFGSEVPVLQSTLTTSAGQGAALANQINYKDTGVSLTVAAAAIDKQIADLTIKQSVSDVSQSVVAGVNSPVFDQRAIDTHVRMRFGDTLMLGGIIEHQRNDNDSGAPVLSRIPVLGALFGTRQRSGSRTEYVLLLRPRLYSVMSGGPSIDDARSTRFERLGEYWDRLHVRNPFPTDAASRTAPLDRP